MAEVVARTVPPRGPEDSPFVIVGEAPSMQEVKTGQIFSGPSGQVLQAGLDQYAKGSYTEPFVINVIPHMLGKDKDADIVQKLALAPEYRDQLLLRLRQYPRKIIIAMGNAALWALTGDASLKITKVRGRLFPSDLSEHGILATVHPSFLLRGSGSFAQYKADFAYGLHLATGGQPRNFVPPTWKILTTVEEVQEFVKLVHAHDGLCTGDIETSGFRPRMDKILSAGFTLDGRVVYLIPGYKKEYRLKYPVQDLLDALAPMWNVSPSKVHFNWHNGKFDIKFFRFMGQNARVDDDTMLLSYALNESRGIHDLETVSSDWLSSPNWKGELDKYKKKNESYDVIPADVLFRYQAYDIANTHNLWEVMRPVVAQDVKSNRLYEKTLIPASDYLAKIEMTGMFVDLKRVDENREVYEAEAAKHESAIEQIARDAGMPDLDQTMTKGGKKIKRRSPINVNSPIQLSNLLFDVLRIKSKVRGTDEKVLNSLPAHPAVVELRHYRKIAKGLSTYVMAAYEHLQDDGRIHPTYLLHGTATGRLACKDPNLQNIPRDPQLRGQFIARPGYCLAEVDLNQAELRSLAALSGDPELCRIYLDPASKGLHEEVRYSIFGNPNDWSPAQLQKYMDRWYTTTIERVLEEQKMRAKNTNFGIIYGITAMGLAEQIEDTVAEAARMLAAWAAKFPVAWGFIQKCREAPLRGQNLVTVFGHKKRFGVVTPETLSAIQNEAANFPHQSTASTVTMHGGMRIQDRLLRDYDTRICNTVHDSILMEIPLDRKVIDEVTNLAIATMQQIPVEWGITQVPFKADAKAGLRWGNLKGLPKFYKEMGWEDAA